MAGPTPSAILAPWLINLMNHRHTVNLRHNLSKTKKAEGKQLVSYHGSVSARHLDIKVSEISESIQP